MVIRKYASLMGISGEISSYRDTCFTKQVVKQLKYYRYNSIRQITALPGLPRSKVLQIDDNQVHFQWKT